MSDLRHYLLGKLTYIYLHTRGLPLQERAERAARCTQENALGSVPSFIGVRPRRPFLGDPLALVFQDSEVKPSTRIVGFHHFFLHHPNCGVSLDDFFKVDPHSLQAEVKAPDYGERKKPPLCGARDLRAGKACYP